MRYTKGTLAPIRNDGKTWSREEIDYLKRYYPTVRTSRLATVMGRRKQSVTAMAGAYRLTRMPDGRTAKSPKMSVAQRRWLLDSAKNDTEVWDLGISALFSPDCLCRLRSEYLRREADPSDEAGYLRRRRRRTSKPSPVPTPHPAPQPGLLRRIWNRLRGVPA